MKLQSGIFFIAMSVLILFKSQINLHAQNPLPENAKAEAIGTGFNFTEGPLWIDGLGLLFSDIPEDKVFLMADDGTVTEYISSSGNSNGLALDTNGDLILAQHGPRQVSRMGDDMVITPIATHYNGNRLNSPNDIAVHSDGSIFFTDPLYGLWDQNGVQETPYCGIYRISPAGDVQLLDSSLTSPNGIAFSPDESILYVNDCQSHTVYKWDVVNDTSIANKKVFAVMSGNGCADGMKVDNAGNIFTTGPQGVWVYAPDGTFYGKINLSQTPTNCNFKGEDQKTLFITMGSTVYRVDLTETVNEINKTSLNNNWPDPYPNPAKKMLNIPVKQGYSENITVDIFLITGQKVYTIHSAGMSENKLVVDTRPFSQGLYYLVGYSLNESLFTKHVVIR